ASPRVPPSFPTRRSSDLTATKRAAASPLSPFSCSIGPPVGRCALRPDAPVCAHREPRWRIVTGRRGLESACVLTLFFPRVRLPRSEEHTSELQSRENLVC